MSRLALAMLQSHVDRAVSSASGYVIGLVDMLKSTADALPVADPEPSTCDGLPLFLPGELLYRVFNFLDVEILLKIVPFVCKSWKTEVERFALGSRVSRKLLEQGDDLSRLGPPISSTHLYLALCGRNLLRNPAFHRECNTQLLELGRQTWNRTKREAWVVVHSAQHGLEWEQRAAGFVSNRGCGGGAPPPPVPYSGGGLRLGERVQQQLKGWWGNLAAAAAAGRGPVVDEQPQSPEGVQVEEPHGQVAPTCIATPAEWVEVIQVVDLDWELQRRGLTAAQAAHLLDAELGLRLSVHVGARADSLGEFSVGLVLDEGAANGAVPQIQFFVAGPSRYRYFSGKMRCGGRDGWQRFEHRVASCPRGFRRALVMLRGRRANVPRPTLEEELGLGSGGAAAAPPPPPLPVACGAKFACAELVFE